MDEKGEINYELTAQKRTKNLKFSASSDFLKFKARNELQAFRFNHCPVVFLRPAFKLGIHGKGNYVSLITIDFMVF